MMVYCLLLILQVFGIASASGSISAGDWKIISSQHDNSDPTRPRTRYSHSASLVESRMIVTHGYFYDHSGKGPQWLDDTFSFDLESKSWEKLCGGSKDGQVAPSPRMSHSALYYGDRFLLFGGDDGSHKDKSQSGYKGNYLNDLWELDVHSGQWSELTHRVADGITPKVGFAHHSAVGIGGNSMVVFGGLRQDEMWQYQYDSNAWVQIQIESGPNPGKRHGHGATASPDNTGFYIFGGYCFEDDLNEYQTKVGPLDDLWYFDLDTKIWTILESSHPSGGRTYGSLAVFSPSIQPNSHHLMLFAGANCRGSCKCFGDTWTYSLETHTWEMVAVDKEPITRYKQSLVLYKSAIYTFGGESYQPYMYHNSVTKLAWGLEATSSKSMTSANMTFLQGVSVVVLVLAWAVVSLFWHFRRHSMSAVATKVR